MLVDFLHDKSLSQVERNLITRDLGVSKVFPPFNTNVYWPLLGNRKGVVETTL